MLIRIASIKIPRTPIGSRIVTTNVLWVSTLIWRQIETLGCSSRVSMAEVSRGSSWFTAESDDSDWSFHAVLTVSTRSVDATSNSGDLLSMATRSIINSAYFQSILSWFRQVVIFGIVTHRIYKSRQLVTNGGEVWHAFTCWSRISARALCQQHKAVEKFPYLWSRLMYGHDAIPPSGCKWFQSLHDMESTGRVWQMRSALLRQFWDGKVSVSQKCTHRNPDKANLTHWSIFISCHRYLKLEYHPPKPVVGSSRKRTDGFSQSWTPMLVRRFSPPLQPLFLSSPILVSAHSLRPSSRIISSTTWWRASRLCAPRRRRSTAYWRDSRTVRDGIRQSCCMT